MVVCVAEGVVTLDHLMEYFAALEAAEASHYRKILDATNGRNALSEADLAKLAAYAKSLTWRGTPGPMAIVTGSVRDDTLVANVRAMLRPGRRVRTFRTIHEARQWIDSAPLGRRS